MTVTGVLSAAPRPARVFKRATRGAMMQALGWPVTPLLPGISLVWRLLKAHMTLEPWSGVSVLW